MRPQRRCLPWMPAFCSPFASSGNVLSNARDTLTAGSAVPQPAVEEVGSNGVQQPAAVEPSTAAGSAVPQHTVEVIVERSQPELAAGPPSFVPVARPEDLQSAAAEMNICQKRNLRRRMEKYSRELRDKTIQEVPQHHAELYQRYLTGDLDRELDALTDKHGYGRLRSPPEHLGPPGLTRMTPA